MPNVICNGGFEDGLHYWATFNGVEAVDADVLGAPMRLARIPPLGELNQLVGDRLASGDLHFMWYSLGSSRPMLTAIVYYSDRSHDTFALTVERFNRYPMYWANLPVDRDKPVHSIRIVNPGRAAETLSGVNTVTLNSAEARMCWRRPSSRTTRPAAWMAPPRELRTPLPFDLAEMSTPYEPDELLAAKLFEIDLKLERILDLMKADARPGKA